MVTNSFHVEAHIVDSDNGDREYDTLTTDAFSLYLWWYPTLQGIDLLIVSAGTWSQEKVQKCC